MIILHAGKDEKQFFVWGEGPAEEDVLAVKRGRPPKNPVEKPYPFDAGVEGLSSALEALSVDTGRREAENITVWMPTRAGSPIPSSPLIADTPDSKAKLTLTPWTVSAYLLEADELTDFLCTCMGKRVLAPGIIPGSDLLWWAEALKFAGSLAAGQKYLPGVRVEEGKYRAFWEPVFAGEDAEGLVKLAKQMPPVARALTQTPSPELSAQPPEMPAAFVRRAVYCRGSLTTLSALLLRKKSSLKRSTKSLISFF